MPEPAADQPNKTEWQDQCQLLAVNWHTAIKSKTYLPRPDHEVREVLYQLLVDSAAIFLTDTTEDEEELLNQSRAIGHRIVHDYLLKPEALESSLHFLGQSLDTLVPDRVIPPDQITLFLAGVAGGYSREVREVMLRQQEAIGHAKTIALQKAREALAASRDELVAVNRILSEEIEQRRYYASRLENLHHTHVSILSSKSLANTLEQSIELIEKTIPGALINIFLYDFENKTVGPLQSNMENPPPKSPITMWDMVETLQAGQTFYLEDVRSVSSAPSGIQATREMGKRSILSVPLIYRQQLLGGIGIGTSQIYQFSPEEIVMLRETADAVAVAIQHHQLLETEQIARQQADNLREVTVSIAAGLDLDTVLHTILEQLQQLLPTMSSAILLWDGRHLSFASARGFETDLSHQTDLFADIPLNLRAILSTKLPFIISDTEQYSGWLGRSEFGPIRSSMGIPLIVKDTCIGILTLDRDQPNAFSQEDLSMAKDLANYAAIAIENARLYSELQAHAHRQETHVQERTRELNALYEIAAAAAEDVQVDIILRRSLEQAVKAFNCPAGCVFMEAVDEDDEAPYCLAYGNESLVGALESISPDTYRAVWDAATDGSFFLEHSDPLCEQMKDMARFCAIAPLRSRGRQLGIINLVNINEEQMAPESLAFLTAIADQIGTAVEIIRLRYKAREAAVLAERDRLARELHDAVTQNLYSLTLFAEAARETITTKDLPRTTRHLESVLRQAKQALAELRLMLFELRSDTAAQKGLADALSERLKSVENRAGIASELEAQPIRPLPLEVEEVFYRVALEALNNTLRHSHAQKVMIHLREEKDDLVMSITDDGEGFDVKAMFNSGGMGLASMNQRVSQINGTLTINSTPGSGGTNVKVRAPLRPSYSAG